MVKQKNENWRALLMLWVTWPVNINKENDIYRYAKFQLHLGDAYEKMAMPTSRMQDPKHQRKK